MLLYLDKHFNTFVEYHPYIPKICGLLKSLQTEISLRPMISSVGSAPYKITKLLTQIVTSFLDIIWSSHINNSGDLLNKINNINMKSKSLIS